VLDTATNSLQNNRTNFLNICDSNNVDVVLAGHEHQNVVAGRKGDTVSENWPNGTRYVQTAAAFNRSYRIITVDPAFVTVGPPLRSCRSTGVNEVNNSTNISVYPNPAGNALTIGCARESGIEILNTKGQILQRSIAKDFHTTVDISHLSSGIYILKVRTGDGIAVKKFIKQ